MLSLKCVFFQSLLKLDMFLFVDYVRFIAEASGWLGLSDQGPNVTLSSEFVCCG